MNNVISLVLDLKDLMSKQMAMATTYADKSLGNIAASAQRMSSSVMYSSAKAGNSIGDIGKAADVSVRKIDRLKDAMSHLRSGASSLSMTSMIGGAALAGTLSLGALGIVKAGASAQQDLIGLSTFVGEKKAKGIYAQLQQDANDTPFGLSALLSVDKALISAGVDASKARTDMLGLANAISATGGGNDELARMASNMQQIKNAGEATATDIRQFSYAGINIYQLLAAATGKTIAQTQDMTVSYDLLSFALNKAATSTGLYHDAMHNQAQTIFGKWSTLMDTITTNSAKIGMSLSSEITKIVDQWIGYANALPELAKRWTPAIMDIVTGLGELTSMLMHTAQWLYHNWYWLKYAAATGLTLYAAIKALNIGLGIYNTITAVSAARTALFATATTGNAVAMGRTAISTGWATTATASFGYAAQEASVGVMALDTAMAATPWGAILLGIAAVGTAIGVLVANSKDAGKDIANNLNEGIKGIKIPSYQPTNDDYKKGLAEPTFSYSLFGGSHMTGYKWLANDLTDLKQHPLTGYEQARLDKLGGTPGDNSDFTNRYGKKFELQKILKERVAEAAKLKKEFVITMPQPSPTVNLKGDNSPYSGLYKGKTGAEDIGDSIVGGGKKSININFYKDAIKQVFTVADMAAAAKMSVEEFTLMLMRSIQSVKGAI